MLEYILNILVSSTIYCFFPTKTMKPLSQLDNLSTSILGISGPARHKELHSHKIAQLSIPTNGAMYIVITGKLFIVPSGMAIFIPKNTKHLVQKVSDKTIIENIYLTNKYENSLPKHAQSFYLSTLAKAVVTKLCTLGDSEFNSKQAINLTNVLLNELEDKSILAYSVKIPQSPRLLKVYHLFVDSNDSYPSVIDAAEHINVSSRTLLRMFKDELGVSFTLWKQQFIFIKALELLQGNNRTTTAAYKLGYNSDSAFISMFKKMSGGKTPSSFF